VKPKEEILMTINTFKKLCLKAGTSKADKIHDYYIKLEELLFDTINEESTDLRNQLILKDSDHKTDVKMVKHNLLVSALKTKRCVYVGEIEENTYIKIGSSKIIDDRLGRLTEDYGKLIFLEVFECEHFREVEENILKDPVIVKNLCKKIIKVNGHKSKEVVQLSDSFNYDQLLAIVKKHVSNGNVNALNPVQVLEKQKLDLESKKLDHELLLSILNNGKFTSDVQKILENVLSKTMQNTLENSSSEKTEIKSKQVENSQILSNTFGVSVKGEKPRGKKIQKIDPVDLTKVIKVYDSMIYLLRSPENDGFQNVEIRNAIKESTLYKGFRWNFIEKGDDPSISTIKETVFTECKPNSRTVFQLNSTKTEILDSFGTKKSLEKILGLTKKKLYKIISNDIKFNDSYFVEYNNCSKELLNKYDNPINTGIESLLYKIKQINPITKDVIIFKSLNEINVKLGLSSYKINEAIKNKTILGGSFWEYCDKTKNMIWFLLKINACAILNGYKEKHILTSLLFKVMM
jgi:hypothetical protein